MNELRDYAMLLHKTIMKCRPQLPPGIITTTAGFIAEHGRSFAIDGLTFKRKRGRRHDCYRNAGMVALGDDDLLYVEGFVSVHGVPIDHAWLATPDGFVRETTATKKGIGGYFGVPFPAEYLRRTLLRTKMWGIFGPHNIEILKQPFG